jgi:membrane protein
MSIGLVLAAWSGSNVFGTLMGALNTAYDVQETRSWIKQQAIRLGTFVLGAIVLIVSTVVFLEGGAVANWIGNVFQLGSVTVLLWKILQFPIALAGLTGLAFVTLYLLPNVKQRKGQVLVGAALTTLLWVIATLLFRLYVSHFPPNPAYGIIGGIIILLTWMYYTMFIVLSGGELASELHHGTGAVAPDKGAIYLGRIVTGSGPGSESVERG